MPGGKHKPGEDQEACERRKRRELELDDALENTFPASDPVSIEQPVPPALPRDNG